MGQAIIWSNAGKITDVYIEGILPKGPYPPCLCMADRAFLAGYPRYAPELIQKYYEF